MTLGEAKEAVYILLDTTAGTSIAEKQKAKFNRLFNIAQNEIAAIKPIRKKTKVSVQSIENLLAGDMFSVQEHTTEDVIRAATGAAAYHLAVDDAATIYIEKKAGEIWDLIATVTNTTVNGFTAYKGLIDSEATDEIRIRFSGDYFYRMKNIALFGVKFSSAARIPDYQNYIRISMPEDFYKFQNLKNEDNNEQVAEFYWENANTLMMKYGASGEYVIEYHAKPTQITTATADSYEFEISEEAQEAMPFFVAANCLIKEYDQRPYVALLSQYQGKLANLDMTTVQAPKRVRNTLFGG